MSKVNQIQAELKAIGGGSFQKLCDVYLMQFTRYANLKPIGAAIGKDKTTTGVPDSIITLPDGAYAFPHYTTQESGLVGKLKDDLESSFDEPKTGVPVDQIKEVILCHNGSLETKDELALIGMGKERGVIVTIFGLERIAYDLFSKYPGLARDFLNVEVDTGQIVSPEEFVFQYGKSSLSTRLDTRFHFREDELRTILDALESQDLVLITGPAGVGKSRLMLEAGYRFASTHEGWIVRCVYNRGVDLFQDLRTYFKHPGNYLLLVDDANRLGGFDYILQLLHDQTDEVRLKIVVTVREYARDKVVEKLATYGGGFEIQLRPFSDDEIRTLVSEEAHIHNYHFLKRITDIARGNPRLAMMAAKLAVEKQALESIFDVSSLYDEYFGPILHELQELGDEGTIIKVAGVVSFFRVVDRSSSELMDSILKAFDIPPTTFWLMVEQLHQKEILDLHEEEVAKFSDQVLATYFFYVAVFKRGTLDLSILLDHFFLHYRLRFIDALNPVINSLGARIEDQLRPHIERKWKALEEAGPQDDLIALIQTFWFVRPTETLLYVRDSLRELPVVPVDVGALDFNKEDNRRSAPLLDILGSFYGGSHFATALELVLEVFARNPKSLPNVLHILRKDFGFKPTSSLLDFAPQREVVNRLWARTEGGQSILFSKLFLAVARHYLRTQFETTEARSKLVVAFVRFNLHPEPGLQSLRQTIWQHLFTLYSVPELQGEVLELLHYYSHSGYEISEPTILAHDAEEVIPFMMSALDPNNFEHVSTVHDYLDVLDREGVTYDTAIRDRFTTQVSRVADLLFTPDRFHRSGRSFEEEEAFRGRELREYVASFTVEDYKQLLRQCLEIQNDTRQSDLWDLQRNIAKLFAIAEEKGAEFYTAAITAYIEMGSPFNLSGRRVVESLIRFNDVETACSIISERDFPDKLSWLFDFVASIPPSEIKGEHLEQLYDLYRTAPARAIPVDFDFLERYIPLDKHVVVHVVEILLSRMEEEQDSSFAHRLSFLFNPHATSSETLVSHFGTEGLVVLKRAYLAGLTVRDHSDYEGRVFNLILDLDRVFLREYISLLVEEAEGNGRKWLGRADDSRDFAFLWRRNDYESVLADAIQFLFELWQSEEFHTQRYLEVLFGSRRSEEVNTDLAGRQTTLLGRLITERADDADFMEFIFNAVGELPEDKRRELIGLFLKNNKRAEVFQRLSLEPSEGGWSGSAVPYYQKKLDFAESLLPLVEGLDYLDHRSRIENWIKGLQKTIEHEKRRDFMEEV